MPLSEPVCAEDCCEDANGSGEGVTGKDCCCASVSAPASPKVSNMSNLSPLLFPSLLLCFGGTIILTTQLNSVEGLMASSFM